MWRQEPKSLAPRSLPLWLALLAIGPVEAPAGPNAGGVLLVHAQEAPYSSDDVAVCGHPLPIDCAGTRARVDGQGAFLFSILAAFPEDSSPRVAGATFGIEYDPGIQILDYRSCGDFELVTDDWPASGSGIAVVWIPLAETDRMFEMCAFLGYHEGAPGLFSSAVHPTQGAAFVDDGIINDPESPVAFGSLGFGVDGSFECPDPPTPILEGSWGSVRARFRDPAVR